MKGVIGVIFLAAFIFSCKSAKPNPWAESEAFQQWCRATFQSDSGFVSLQQEQQLEMLFCQLDTSILPPEYCSLYTAKQIEFYHAGPDSSGGKYYRETGSNGLIRWVLCVSVNIDRELPHVFEILQRKNKFYLSSWTYYQHGNWACCWDDKPMSGFYRLGPYYLLETCNTGSEFCSGDAHVLFFPLHKPVDTDTTTPAIPVSASQRFLEEESLTGSLSCRGDTIVGNYFYQADSIVDINEDSSRTVPLRHSQFQAFFKVNTKLQKIELLNKGVFAPAIGTGLILYQFE